VQAVLIFMARRKIFVSRRVAARVCPRASARRRAPSRLTTLATLASLLAATTLATRSLAIGSEPTAFESARQQLVVRLRSFVPGASGRVVVEPNESGGRVRVIASKLPAPASVAPDARAYIVWATGGEVRRVGELRRDARGDAAFEFAHPAGFASYSLLVTAERDARIARPAGAFVFSTRAGEVSAFYPPKPEPRVPSSENSRTSAPAIRSRTVIGEKEKDAARAASSSSTSMGARVGSTVATLPASASEFYESIDSAVGDSASARTLTLAGPGGASRARGDAQVAMREGTAYVRVRFRHVPSPARYGARKYVMWAQLAEDGPLFLRALPARGLNRRATYARRRDVNSPDFRLFVTAERRYPRPRPAGRQVLKTVNQ
jgi:hypothetical protein